MPLESSGTTATPAVSCHFGETKADAASTYQYKLRAVDQAGNASDYSNTVTVLIVD